ncbi:alanine dehydrogenase [Flavobacteriaceae bacterium]|nr:alanine dehydrogenase [Flavobacteriaceae bacterium]
MSSSYSPFSKKDLQTQEERLEIGRKKSALEIGIPKEIAFEERRVCLSPDSVSTLINQGHTILVETNAGAHAGYLDREYSEVGAEIVYDKKTVFSCKIILKVEPPTQEEIGFMKPNTTVLSALQIKTRSSDYFNALCSKKITAIALDNIKDEHGNYPIVSSLSEIAGASSIQIASELLMKNGYLLGNISGVPPTEVVIIGAGRVGEYAAKTALGLGAYVKVFDDSITRLQNLENKLGQKIYTATLQPKLLLKSLKRCHVAIGALKGANRCPIIINETMVENMKEDAVIIDVCIDRGGNFESSELTSHSKPFIMKHGVMHYAVPNIPSKYPKTSTQALSNILSPYLSNIANEGGIESMIKRDSGFQNGVYVYKGILTSKQVGDWFNLKYRDLNLLIL